MNPNVCQAKVRLFGRLWRVKCGAKLPRLGWTDIARTCPKCGATTRLPARPAPVQVPHPWWMRDA